MFVSAIGTVRPAYSMRATQALGRVGRVEAVAPVGPREPETESVARIREQPAAVLQLSAEGRELARQNLRALGVTEATGDAITTDGQVASDAELTGQTSGDKPSEEEQKKIAQLKSRDQEVRAHEQAHKSAGGQFTGAIHFEYEQGPDGQKYAVGGHVDIDVSPVKGDPRATLAKMQQVTRAALAPGDPSSADRSVAASAAQLAATAAHEIGTNTQEDASEPGAGDSSAKTSFADLLSGALGKQEFVG